MSAPMRQHGGMLNGMPPIFVVSLVRETDRRARMQKELKARQLDFNFFDAVDGAELAESCYRHRMQEQWWRNGLAFCAVDPAIVTHAAIQPVIQTLPKVRRTMLQHAAAASHRLADWLYLRSVGSESLDMPPPAKPE